MQQSEHIRSLFSRYMDGTITNEQRIELSEAVEEYSTAEWEEIVLPLLQFTQPDAGFKVADWEDQLRFILQQPPVKTGRTISLKWYRYAAAAVVLALLIGSYFIFVKDGDKPSPSSQPVLVVKDLPPGHDGAILTLADGKTIVLDSTFGNIANESGVAVINKDGSVSYQPTANSDQPSANSEQLVYHTMSTPRGRQYQLSLPDGTKVWLNAASSIRFPTAFKGKSRVVEVTGEAYFEVAHNAAKPFIVSVNDIQVEVLGTHFNVNSYADEGIIKTTLLQGKVRVTSSGGIALLNPGQQAEYNANSQKLTPNSSVDIEQVMAWKNGWFEFNNTDLVAIMKQVSRWYDVDVVFQGRPGPEKFGGRLSRNLSLSYVLKLLEENGAKFKWSGKTLTVIP